MAELVDAPDLKSCDQLVVWVRFPLVPPVDAGIAQLIEHRSCKADVVGLNPTTGSKKNSPKEVTHLTGFGYPM